MRKMLLGELIAETVAAFIIITAGDGARRCSECAQRTQEIRLPS